MGSAAASCVVGMNAQIGTFSPSTTGSCATVIPGQSTGTATNDNANAGNIGEYISSTILAGSAVSLSNGAPKDITTVSLTAGDWDCRGDVQSLPGSGTTTAAILGWINTTSATVPTGSTALFNIGSLPSNPNQVFAFPVGDMRFSLSGTTTVYLSMEAGFSVSTLTGYGSIGCRRAR
jgi:hypothetical protein